VRCVRLFKERHGPLTRARDHLSTRSRMAGLSYSLSRYGSASTSTCPPPRRAQCQAGRASRNTVTMTARGPAEPRGRRGAHPILVLDEAR
jgi:hypothetical protein